MQNEKTISRKNICVITDFRIRVDDAWMMSKETETRHANWRAGYEKANEAEKQTNLTTIKKTR